MNLSFLHQQKPGQTLTLFVMLLALVAGPGALAATATTTAPEPDVPGGFQSQNLRVSLASPTPDARIHYTLDGSPPVPGASPEYSQPLDLAPTGGRGAVTLRAIAVADGGPPSDVTTHTYLFPEAILKQSATPAGFPAAWVDSSGRNTVTADYEMDPEVVEDPNYATLAREALTSIPTVSLVTDIAALFDRRTGIYSNPEQYGELWERACSVEFLYPQEGRRVQLNAGLRIQGGTSRIPDKAHKHSLRLLFKSEYGASRLDGQFFPDSPVERFDTLVLDAGLNLVWIHPEEAQRNAGQYVRDQVVADWQNAMGHPAPHGRWFHVYLNGLYWGLFGVHERPDDPFAASYLGGAKEEWDIVKNTTGFEVVGGTRTEWDGLLARVAATGTDAASLADLGTVLDLTAFADYLLLNFYAGNTDWPHHNWYAGRRRIPGARWHFFSWDAEHVFKNLQDNRTTANETATPGGIWNVLRRNPEFRQLFADRVQRHTTGKGVFAVDASQPAWNPDHPERNLPAAAYMRRIREIDPAIVLESARWGDDRREPPYTRNAEWLTELNKLLRDYFPRRTSVLLSQLRSAGLLPSTPAPTVTPFGGHMTSGLEVVLHAPGGHEIWWTRDTSDPRQYGSGSPAPSAERYTTPLRPVESTRIRARTRSAQGEWSALVEADFTVPSSPPALSIAEILYAPSGGSAFEFIELWNPGTLPVDAGGYSFVGIESVLPAGWTLGPGERAILANDTDPAEFLLRYPGVEVAAWYKGNLSNTGERLALRDRALQTVTSVTWDSGGDWPSTAGGHSIESTRPSLDPGEPLHWIRSPVPGGTPGHATSHVEPAVPATARLHEIHPGGNGTETRDWVELLNPTQATLSLANWQLADRLEPTRGLALGASQTIEPGGYLVLFLDPAIFGLDRDGDRVVLLDPSGHRVDSVAFGPIPDGFTLGRTASNTWTLNRPTPGTANEPAPLAPAMALRINEIFPNPIPGADDWLEIHNGDQALPAALEGLVLQVRPTNPLDPGDSAMLRIPAFVPPGGHTVLRADRRGGAGHVDLKLPAAGASLALLQAEGSIIDSVRWTTTPEGVSMGRWPDGAPVFDRLPTTTPGDSNIPSPRLTGVRLVSGTSVEITVEAPWIAIGFPDLECVIETSSDLGVWEPLHWTVFTGQWTVTVDAQSGDRLFFRARLEDRRPAP